MNEMDEPSFLTRSDSVGAHKKDEFLDKDKVEDEGEGQIHVIYLNVSESDEPQALDLSSLLVQENIQVVQTSSNGHPVSDSSHLIGSQDIVIENNSGAEITMVAAGPSEAQSADALLRLAESQGQVEEIFATQKSSEVTDGEEQDAASAKALLQLSSDPNTTTYILDDSGAMIPLNQVRLAHVVSRDRSDTLLEIENASVTTIDICQCWCGQEFISQENFDQHKLDHKYQEQKKIDSNSYKCQLCPEILPSVQELTDHHTKIHPDVMPWECSICHRRFSKKIGVKAHMRAHCISKHQCTMCKRTFFYKIALARHMQMHTNGDTFKCSICGDVFKSQWDLRKHRMSHQPQTLYRCHVCAKVFKQKQTLLIHSRVHTGQRPFPCNVCHKNFSLKSTLKQHKRIHTGEKPNICHVCHRAFRQGSTLKSHMKIHTCLKPYMCRYCKMRFAFQDEVTEHEHTHMHNKNWQCDECGMRFRNQSLLARHSRVHSNERPFQCNICSRRFIQSGSLQAHMRSHTKEKPYQCRWCDKAYTTSGTLLIHIRKAHKVDAKKVKDVFPVCNYIEDQKVFTIRSRPLTNDESVMVNMDMMEQESTASVEEEEVDNALSRNESHSEEILEVDTTEEIIVKDYPPPMAPISTGEELVVASPQQDNNLTIDYIDDEAHETHDGDVVKLEVASEIQITDVEESVNTESVHTEQVVEEEETVSVGDPCIVPLIHNQHSAQDRQEAALGLAELSLVGGEDMQVEKTTATPGKTKTFFREEEEDDNDPDVTKIILSKEGGIMNSQDPHQCPVCARIFGRKSIMTEHLRIHTDEKPYECDFCHAGFRQNAQLRSHIRNRHTKVERFQCSFCHKRFLSPSITIRHINFHHKLKVKYCKGVDDSWDIQSAVWADDSFELNVKDPQFLQTGQKSLRSSKVCKKLSTADGTVDKDVLDVKVTKLFIDDAEEGTETDVSQMGEQIQVAQEDRKQKVQGLGEDHLLKPQKDFDRLMNSSTSYHPSMFAADSSSPIESKVLKVEISEPTDSPSCDSANAVSNSTTSTHHTQSQSSLSETILTASASKFETSKLQCGTCSVSFLGVSSLRCHLKTVHNTTLANSDVSFVYIDKPTSTGEISPSQQMSGEIEPKELIIDSSTELKGTHNHGEEQPFKIVIYDDKDKCVDDPNKSPYACCICLMGFNSKMDLDEHMRQHSAEEVESAGLHRCDTCHSVMKNTQQLSKHILKFHGVKQLHVCSICHKEFFQVSSVHRHMKFFHKWEIKIRGESSIPVLIKPAPSSIQMPTGTVHTSSQNISPEVNKPKFRVTTRGEDNVTFISLEVGDLENLQVFGSNGQEVSYEVVNSSNQVKTLKIKADQATEESAFIKIKSPVTKLQSNPTVPTTSCSSTVIQHTSQTAPSDVRCIDPSPVSVKDEVSEPPFKEHVLCESQLPSSESSVVSTSTTDDMKKATSPSTVAKPGMNNSMCKLESGEVCKRESGEDNCSMVNSQTTGNRKFSAFRTFLSNAASSVKIIKVDSTKEKAEPKVHQQEAQRKGDKIGNDNSQVQAVPVPAPAKAVSMISQRTPRPRKKRLISDDYIHEEEKSKKPARKASDACVEADLKDKKAKTNPKKMSPPSCEGKQRIVNSSRKDIKTAGDKRRTGISDTPKGTENVVRSSSGRIIKKKRFD